MSKKIIFSVVLMALSNVWAKDSDKFTSIRVETSFSKTELDSKDANGEKLRLLSNNNLGVALSLAEHWDTNNTTFLKVQYNNLSFNQVSSVIINNSDQSLLGLGVGHTYTLNSNLRLSGGLYLNEEIFVRAKDTGILTIDKFSNVVLKTDIEYDLVSLKDVSLGASGGVDVSAPFKAEAYGATEGSGNYEVKPAIGYGGSLYGRKFLYGYSIEGSIFVKLKSTETSVSTQNIINQGIGLRVAIPFGD